MSCWCTTLVDVQNDTHLEHKITIGEKILRPARLLAKRTLSRQIRRITCNSHSLDSNTAPVDRVCGDPSVDAASIISDLEPRALDRFDQVQVLRPVYLAEDDIANRKACRMAGTTCRVDQIQSSRSLNCRVGGIEPFHLPAAYR